jgi:hypothetical protein
VIDAKAVTGLWLRSEISAAAYSAIFNIFSCPGDRFVD